MEKTHYPPFYKIFYLIFFIPMSLRKDYWKLIHASKDYILVLHQFLLKPENIEMIFTKLWYIIGNDNLDILWRLIKSL